MKPKYIWANFSVKDASRTNQFYLDLGFKPNKKNSDPKLASFHFGEDDFVIHFFQQDTQINEYINYDAKNGSEIIFTLSAETEQEVKDWEEKVKAAGGSVLYEAGRDKAGYYGFAFADPDGHKFNILLMERGM
jgi:predicted lactoylglutathione lyase